MKAGTKQKLVYKTDVIIGIRLGPGHRTTAGPRIACLDNVVYAGYTTGRFDMIIEELFESEDQLFSFLSNTLGKVPGVLDTEIFGVLRTLKINYDWKLPTEPRKGGRDANTRG